MPRCYRWRKQSENSLFLGRWRPAATTHKDTHKLQTFPAISSHIVAHPRRTLNRQKSFIQRSFGTIKLRPTFWGTTASLGLEPRLSFFTRGKAVLPLKAHSKNAL